jgi:hypothetical protein
VSGRDFTRTAAALAAYDAAGEAMDRVDPRDGGACLAAVAAWDAALRAVAEAVADDTSDVNDRAVVLAGFGSHRGIDLRMARQWAAGFKSTGARRI